MEGITRYDVNEEWAHSGMIRAGDFCFLNYCAGNVGGTVEEQINGAFDEMERRLALAGLTLENVVQMDCLFRDVWNIPVMEKVIKERFNGRDIPFASRYRRILRMSAAKQAVCCSR